MHIWKMNENLDSCNFPMPNAFGGGKQETIGEREMVWFPRNKRKERKGNIEENNFSGGKEQFNSKDIEGAKHSRDVCKSNKLEEGTPIFRGTTWNNEHASCH